MEWLVMMAEVSVVAELFQEYFIFFFSFFQTRDSFPLVHLFSSEPITTTPLFPFKIAFKKNMDLINSELNKVKKKGSWFW